jgi:nucleotide-binding universal stress UspA family protein
VRRRTDSAAAWTATLALADAAARVQPETDLVLGFDRDAASQAALEVARDLADRLRAHLTVVHVVSLHDYPIDPDLPNWEDLARQTLAEERSLVERALTGHRFGWSYQACHGSPVDVLVQVAEERDALVIVVGRHGHGIGDGLRRLIDGSVSHRVLQRCGRPVLVVPHDD